MRQIFITFILCLIPIATLAQTEQEWAELDRLYRTADVAYGSGDYLQALSAYEAAFALTSSAWPEDDLEALTIMNNLAFLHEAVGQYEEAEPLYLQALESSERTLGKDDPDTLTSVNNLALLYKTTGRYAEAEPLLLRALEGRERVLGKEHPNTLRSVNSLALLYQATGRYAKAEPLFQRALDILERELGEDHPDTLNSMSNLASLFESFGRYTEAESLFLRALEGRERVLGEDHPDTQLSSTGLANLYFATGRYTEAELLFLGALENSERVLGKDHLQTLTIVDYLASLYAAAGRTAEAEALVLRALEVSERVLGKNHPQTLNSVNSLARLFLGMGRYAEAEPLYVRALDALERNFGREHFYTASSMGDLATLYKYMGRYVEAEPLYLRALEANKRVLGKDHPETLVTGSNLAGLYLETGRYAEAEPFLLHALEVSEHVLGKNHPQTLVSAGNLAFLYQATGRTVEAEKLYLRSLKGSERGLGNEHPYTLGAIKNLSLLRLSIGDSRSVNDAAAGLLQGLQGQALRVMKQLHSGAGAGLRAEFSADSYLRDIAVSAALAFPDHAALGARALLLTKGVAGEADAALSRLITTDPRPAVTEAAQALSQAEASLFAGLQTSDPSRIYPALTARDAARQALFREIDPPLAFQPEALSPQAIADVLTEGAVFLDYGIYRPVDFTSGQTQASHVVLAAYRPNQSPELFDLGPADALRGAILTLSDMTANLEAPLEGAQTLLSDALLGPVANLLAEADEAIIAPDGILARINFAMLLDPQDTDLHLSERLPLRILPSGRSLLEQPKPASAARSLFLGAALQDYGPYDKERCNSTHLGDTRDGLCPLPNAVREVEQISALFTLRGGVRTLLRNQATEDAIRSSLPGTRFVHLATHGGLRLPGLIGSGGGLNNVGLAFHRTLATPDNQSIAPSNDGILTGAEAARLPLWGTDLVVLSACDTALGEDAGAEGIWSMAHGFRLAGVRAVMMTLWKVNDETAPQFMERFYQNMLERRQEDPSEPITTTLRRALRDTRLWAIKEGWNYWDYAPFVLVES